MQALSLIINQHKVKLQRQTYTLLRWRVLLLLLPESRRMRARRRRRRRRS